MPLAPPAVAGLINLRGQVVTAIDLRDRLGRPPRPEGTDAVRHRGRGCTARPSACWSTRSATSSTSTRPTSRPRRTRSSGPARDLIRGAYKLDGQLLLALDVQKAVSA